MAALKPPIALTSHQTGALENAEVLRNRRQRNGNRCRELTHRHWTAHEARDDTATGRVRKRVEDGIETRVLFRARSS